MAEPQTSLKSNFQQKSCPADLPIYDSGIDPNGVKLSMDRVLPEAFKNARVVMYGDTNHSNPMVMRPLESQKNLDALRDSGVKHVGIELGKANQPLIDKRYDGAITRDELETALNDKGLMDTVKGNNGGEVTRLYGGLAEYGAQNGIKLHAADPGNGLTLGADGKTTDFDEDARFKDGQLASDLNAMDGKVLLGYGHLHFSTNDSGRNDIEGGLVKMDVHQNRFAFENSRSQMAGDAANGAKFNEVKPDLVYFNDTGTVHTTCSTPESLKNDIKKAAERVAAPAVIPGSLTTTVPKQDVPAMVAP